MMEHPGADFESSADAYSVKLSNFEGPLDLLIHLIKKNEMNIYDIPISNITRQYLDYISLMQELDLDIAGEFLVMAATLIHIKSRTLLPRPDPTQDESEEDPRDALVRRLLEHQRFKAAAEMLYERATLRSAQWIRPDGRVAGPGGRGGRARAGGRPLQSDDGIQGRPGNGPASVRPSRCPRQRFQLKCASTNCWRGCRRPTRAGSRSCSATSRRAAGSS